jgi:hypothetical protein
MACQLLALESFKKPKWKRPLWITGTYGEEMGLVGVQKLIKVFRFASGDVLNSEPTGLRMAVGNKGFRIFRIQGGIKKRKAVSGILYELGFQGRAAHSGTAHLGLNACLQALGWLKKQGKACYVVSVEGGLAPNIVAPFCWVKVVAEGEPGR